VVVRATVVLVDDGHILVACILHPNGPRVHQIFLNLLKQ